MSISVGHRAIASAFGWGHGSTKGAVAAFPVAESPAPSAPAPAVPAAVESAVLVCSPWEGLYLEQAHPVAARSKQSAAGGQLGSFLNSLMYGE